MASESKDTKNIASESLYTKIASESLDTKIASESLDTKIASESINNEIASEIKETPVIKMSNEDDRKGEKSKNENFTRMAVPYIEDFVDLSTWIECVEAWSETTDIPLARQGFALAQEIPISSKRYGQSLGEDLYKEIKPSSLTKNEEGVKKILAFIKERFWQNTDEEIYSTYAKIKSIGRKKGQSVCDYIIEYDKMLQKAKQLKINNPNDRVLAMDLIITADLTDTEFVMIRTVADISTEDNKRYQSVRQKMREIFGKIENSKKDNNNDVLLTNSKSEDDITKDQDSVYLSRGWRPPNKQYQKGNNRYQKPYKSKYNNYNNSMATNNDSKPIIRTKKINPTGKDGYPLKCKGCKAITHMLKECPDSYENNNKYKNKKFQTAYVVNQQTDEEEKVLIPISDTESEESQEECNYCSIYCTDNKEDMSAFTAETLNKGALDTCCTSSVCGENWLRVYLKAIPKNMKAKVEGPLGSNKHFIFGNQGKMKAISSYNIPVKIGGEENMIKLDVIQSDIPLLLSKSDMKKLGIALDMKNDRATINDKPLILTTTAAGHYTVDLLSNSEELEEVNITELDEDDDKAQMKALNKIHRQFGHRNKRQFTTILKEAGKWKEKFSGMIDKIMDACEGCIMKKRTPDRPAVAPPMASDFGNVLGMDLKVWDMNKGVYILYMIDIYTRFQVATVIKSKEPNEVVKAFTLKWLPIFGKVDRFITDNGTEFCNEDMREVASALDVIHQTTGANSPWQNGIVERNHQTTDIIINSIKRDYPKMSLEVALAWAISAVNSMSTVRGFSPYQLVFGRQLKLPNILDDPPAAWEEPEKSKTLLETLQAIHAARVEHTKSERCERIRRALKAKIRISDTVYDRGDVVYFKKEDENKWRGPARVIFQDSRVIFIRMGSVYYRVSANRLVKAGDQLASNVKANEDEQDNKNNETNDENIPNIKTRKQHTNIEETVKPDWDRLKLSETEEVSRDNGLENTEDIDEIITHDNNERNSAENKNTEQENPEEERTGRKRKKVNQKPFPEFNDDGTLVNAGSVLKKNDRIEILEGGKWEKGVILGHAGKVSGVNAGWYNLKLDNGQVFNDKLSRRQVRLENPLEDEDEVLLIMKLDNGKVLKVQKNENRKIRLENEEEVLACMVNEEVLAVMIPKDQRNSPAAMAAKMVELEKLKAFDTYQVVDDNGQENITTTWVLTEKGQEVRARLTARGFQEEGNFPTDSPTVQKHSIRLLLAISAQSKWNISTTDISSAFLQGNLLDRDVFIKPPREANLPGKLWKLNKCLYGLKDASRQWYFKVVNKLIEQGFQKCFCDKGVFFLIKDNKLIGFVALHVDDFLHAGNDYFNRVVMKNVLSIFKVGKSETKDFMYTGFRMRQDDKSIKVDQEKYIKNVQVPGLDLNQLKDKKREMTQDELTILRQLTGMVNWAQRATRPDLSFETIELSTKFKGGKVEDLIQAKNVAARLKKFDVTVTTSDVGDFRDCQVWIFTDAAFRNLNNGTDSCGGYFLLIVNTTTGKCAPIEWKSGKIKRKVHSTLAAETLSLYAGLDAAIAIKMMLKEITNGEIVLPVRAITDNRSSRDAIYSESEVAERMLRADISMIKDMVEDGRVLEITWVPGKSMLADILTKRSVNKVPILEVLETGRISRDMLHTIMN